MICARSPPAVSIIIDTCHGKWLSRSGEDLRNIGKIARPTDQGNINFYENQFKTRENQKSQAMHSSVLPGIMTDIP